MSGDETIERAASIVRAGGLVAFPTETVYGLGANALDASAVERIYAVKGRPRRSPIIVHVASIDMARLLALEWPGGAEALAQRFWPGPLTLVVRKQRSIPDVVTAGLDTVGLRMPAHPLALELIRAAGVPIAAPSANPFSRLSPTTAEHVRDALGASVDFILEGGATAVGIESTVLSMAGERPRLLRPGMISRGQIESVIGPVEEAGAIEEEAHPSPGLHQRHYSPATPLILAEHGALPAGGRGAYLWIRHPAPAERSIRMPCNAAGYGALLYDTLHRLDREKLDWIAVEKPPEAPEWAAIHDRLRRAASETG